MTDQEIIRSRFSGIPAVKLDKAIAASLAKDPAPPSFKHVQRGAGVYNAIGLLSVPCEILTVEDESTKALSWKVTGQQVVCSRNLKAPVVVTYVAVASHAAWLEQIIVAISARVV